MWMDGWAFRVRCLQVEWLEAFAVWQVWVSALEQQVLAHVGSTSRHRPQQRRTPLAVIPKEEGTKDGQKDHHLQIWVGSLPSPPGCRLRGCAVLTCRWTPVRRYR